MNLKVGYSLKAETVARIEELAKKLNHTKSQIIDLAIEKMEIGLNKNIIIDNDYQF